MQLEHDTYYLLCLAIILFDMEITKRSFRAFSVAQPMKKEIDETLAKVELEKRRFLALERE